MIFKENAKTCTKCNILKPLDEFNMDKRNKDNKQSYCRMCDNNKSRNYYKEHQKEQLEKSRSYNRDHHEEIAKYRKIQYENGGREKQGKISMYENKLCSQYLGIVIGERLCRHLFKNVEVMPMHNPGYDIVCNKGMKIDVKSVCITLNNKKYPHWAFDIRKNITADYFILVAFDNRTDLNPLHLWMIPGHVLNDKSGTSISLSTIHKWDKYKKDINDAKLCCAEIKRED